MKSGSNVTIDIDMKKVIHKIRQHTAKHNVDNISRTVFYQHFFQTHTEIKWALLASIVSRNAGWNMTDLFNSWFHKILDNNDQLRLFSIYETGNWTIFDDACPQLLVYKESVRYKRPLFELLAAFGVSAFMIKEWQLFWEKHDENRLCTALIINEQQILEQAVIQTKLYQDIIARKLFYKFEQHTHFSYVILPSINGSLYTLYVQRFHKVASRIRLGRKLAYLLFHPEVFPNVWLFCQHTPHTGSRNDYYHYLDWSARVSSLPLRLVYPRIDHHHMKRVDWFTRTTDVQMFFEPLKEWNPVNRSNWVKQKLIALYFGSIGMDLITHK